MPTVNPAPIGPKPQIELANGTPAVGYKLFFYVGGSVNTKQNTYTDSTGTVANTNPLVLNALGQPTTEIWFTAGQGYKVVLAPSTDTDPPTSPVWSIDNLRGVNDTSVTIDQWVTGAAPTFVSGTSFTLAGDQTSIYTIGRRLRFTVTAGTVYGRILTSAYGALTTVTMVMDGSQVLDSGLSAVSYGLLTNDVWSIPERIATASGTDTYTASVGAIRLVTGDQYLIRFTNASTSTVPTLNLDSLGAKTIKTQSGAALVAGNINGEHLIRYNGTDMILLNPIPFSFMTAAGDMIYASAAGVPVRLGIGTALQVLRTNAGATAPEWANSITLGTQQTASTTVVDFTGIPVARRVKIMLDGISTTSNSNLVLQIGDAGGIETSGYVGGMAQGITSAANSASYVIAFMAAGSSVSGVITLDLMNSSTNKWNSSGNLADVVGSVYISAGSKSLSAVLDRVRITTAGGVDTFDAGTINISYE